MNDLVSIIIPIYNVEKYLKRCVDSVIKQSYCNLEIILVDDGSPDRCGEICDEYAQTDIRIKVIHKQNGGLSSARNAGLDICKGDYVLFVDSDDWIKGDAVENALTYIRNSKADILAFSFYVASMEKAEDNYNITHVRVNDFEKNEAAYLLQNFREEWDKVLIVAWNKLYRRKIFDNVRFIEGVYHEDEYAITEILKNADRIHSIDLPFYYYYLSENSIMRNKNKNVNTKKTIDLIQMYRKRVICFLKLGYIEQAKYSFFDYIGTIKESYSQLKKSDRKKIEKEMFELKKLAKNLELRSSLSVLFKFKLKMFCCFPSLFVEVR